MSPTSDNASDYDNAARAEMQRWRSQMLQGPGLFAWAAGRVQDKVNSLIPEKAHAAVSAVIEQMTKSVLTGSELVAPGVLQNESLRARERLVLQKLESYRTSAAVGGAIAGAGGFFLGLAEFPVLLGTKLKFLFDTAALYGHSCAELEERWYLLQVFQLAFSSQQHRRKIFLDIENWDSRRATLPTSLDNFDWRAYQREYRNYIDLAKLVQLIPIIGAPVGAVVNFHLLKQLGETAMNAYRLRWFSAAAGRLTANTHLNR